MGNPGEAGAEREVEQTYKRQLPQRCCLWVTRGRQRHGGSRFHHLSGAEGPTAMQAVSGADAGEPSGAA